MILVRDVFQLKFGKAREATALWKEGRGFLEGDQRIKSVRLLTDLVGSYYTVVLETTYDSLGDFERSMSEGMNDEWRAWYGRYVPLVESGYREMFMVVS